MIGTLTSLLHPAIQFNSKVVFLSNQSIIQIGFKLHIAFYETSLKDFFFKKRLSFK